MELPSRNLFESTEIWRNQLRAVALERHLDWVARLESGDQEVIGEFLQLVCAVENTTVATERLLGIPADQTELSSRSDTETDKLIDTILNHDGALDNGRLDVVSRAIDMYYNSMNFGYVASIG